MNKSVPITPNSPVTPMSSAMPHSTVSSSLANELQQIYDEYKEEEEILPVFKQINLHKPVKITDTLQGSVWRAFTPDNNPLIVKITDRTLHERQRAIIDNEEYKVNENILAEQRILKHLSQQPDCLHSIVQYKGFIKTSHYYWLLMEDGGGSLIALVQKAHRSIRSGHLGINEWKKVQKIIMKQMVEAVEYLHNHNICHFDISLENFVINDLEIEVDEYEDGSWKYRFVLDDIHVKLCDFGLAEEYKSNVKACLSQKWCGKRQYKSPEVCDQRETFDAKRNDVWSLGSCWLAMCIGSIPWQIAHESDAVFAFLLQHSVADLLKYWNIQSYIDAPLMDIFDSIFQDEDDRITVSDIKKHLYIYIS
eukprot:220997_1